MDALATRFANQGVGAYFLYTHEAHPGENYPTHTSMEQKFRHATALRTELGIKRPILVDGLDGDCHRAYGCQPNMTYIFDHRGMVLYKADWTDHLSVANAVEYFLAVLGRKDAGEPQAGFQVSRLDYRARDMQGFFAGLDRAGPRAVREFEQAFNVKRPE